MESRPACMESRPMREMSHHPFSAPLDVTRSRSDMIEGFRKVSLYCRKQTIDRLNSCESLNTIMTFKRRALRLVCEIRLCGYCIATPRFEVIIGLRADAKRHLYVCYYE